MNNEFDKTFGADFINSVPEESGVYIFRNIENTIIYVGKAKNLRKRLSQYRGANRKKKHRKMRAITKKAVQVELKTCSSEKEALLLENQLIQEHKPYLNVSGAYSFLYPYIGIFWDSQKPSWLGVCQTTVPEEFIGTSFTLFGAYRSRAIVGNAYRSLNALIKYIAHKDHKETKRYRDYPYSNVSFYRQVDQDLPRGLTAFFRGESRDGLTVLTEILLEKPDARKDASEIQEHLKTLTLFYEEEAQKLRSMLDKFGMTQSYISQYDRDRLFIAVPVSPEVLKLASEAVEKP
jgi:excinuclease ABC subunit C